MIDVHHLNNSRSQRVLWMLELLATQGFMKDSRPGLRDLVARYHERPAYQRALARGGPYAYA